MKSIILASNNKDKVKEVKEILKGYDIISMKEAGIDVDIEENGTIYMTGTVGYIADMSVAESFFS